jgi:antitoxin component of MazEF toxin-antitoxin module
MTIHFNHAEHTLERLEGFLHDAISEENISAEKIYDTIIENVAANVEHHQIHYQKSKRLFNLLKGYEKLNTETQENVEENTYDDMVAEGYWMCDGGIWINPESKKEDKVVKWKLPVQQGVDDYYVQFPDDLLEAANLQEGDTVEWIDNQNGSYTLKKVT